MRLGKIWWTAIAIVALFVSLACWGFSSPIGSTPDENFHLVNIWCAGGFQEGRCEKDVLGSDYALTPSFDSEKLVCFRFLPEMSAACQADLRGEEINSLAASVVQKTFYPPVFYRVMNKFVTSDIPQSVLAMRMFNAFLYACPLFAVIYLSRPSLRQAVIIGHLVTVIPLAMFIVPSINPSSWTFTGVSLLWAAWIGFLEEHGTRRLLLGIISLTCVLIAAGSRADGAIYAAVSMILATLFVGKLKKRDIAVYATLGTALLVALALFIPTRQRQMITSFNGNYSGLDFVTLLFANVGNLPTFMTGAVGNSLLGWQDTPMPGVTAIGIPMLFCALCVISSQSHSGSQRVVFGLLIALLVIGPLYLLNEGRFLTGQAIQPRYFLPLFTVLLGFVLLRSDRSTVIVFSYTRKTLMLMVLISGNAYALHQNIQRYVTGLDIRTFNLSKNTEWWWKGSLDPQKLWMLGVATFGFATIILLNQKVLSVHKDEPASSLLSTDTL